LRVNQVDITERFAEMLHSDALGRLVIIYGLLRASSLRNTTGAENYLGSDNGLLLQLCCQGPFVKCTDTALFYQRANEQDIVEYYRHVSHCLDPQNRCMAFHLPWWSAGLRFLGIAASANAPPSTRLRLIMHVLQYHFAKRDRLIELGHAIGCVIGIRQCRNYFRRRWRSSLEQEVA
jgi:hypothetical protein